MLAAIVAAVGAAPAAARVGTALVVTGRGWGHGVGMSQWGAYGYARHGWSYGRILRHYYPGTKVGHVRELRVRVLLVSGASSATVGCAAAMRVTDGKRYGHDLPAGRYGLGPRLVLPLRRNGAGRSLGRTAIFECARAPLELDGRPYHGVLVAHGNGRTLSVVNALPLDTYLRGVVPSESPSHWPIAELEAQAVAARSYTVAELRPDAQYDLLPDTRDQVYGGARAERPRSDHAVYATKGEVLTYDGQVARTYYSSSSGGRTEAVQDAWPGSAPIPYLRSVSDPYDVYSPNHVWGPIGLSADRLSAQLGLGSAIDSVQVVRDSSWRVASVRFRLASGAIASRTGEQVARALQLRSTWFSIGQLRLWTSSDRVLYGRPVEVVARTAAAKDAVLQERFGTAWRTVRHVVHGVANMRVLARANTAFRLMLPGVSGTTLDLSVAPRLRVQALGPRLLAGTVLPRTHGPVTVWRWLRGAWKLASRPRVLPTGDFRTALRLRPGNYRITVAADSAFASAQTQLHVTRRLLALLRH